jgi:hypothetical protein
LIPVEFTEFALVLAGTVLDDEGIERLGRSGCWLRPETVEAI